MAQNGSEWLVGHSEAQLKQLVRFEQFLRQKNDLKNRRILLSKILHPVHRIETQAENATQLLSLLKRSNPQFEASVFFHNLWQPQLSHLELRAMC